MDFDEMVRMNTAPLTVGKLKQLLNTGDDDAVIAIWQTEGKGTLTMLQYGCITEAEVYMEPYPRSQKGYKRPEDISDEEKEKLQKVFVLTTDGC